MARRSRSDALIEKVVNLVGLMRSPPGIHDFIEDADDLGVGMTVKWRPMARARSRLRLRIPGV